MAAEERDKFNRNMKQAREQLSNLGASFIIDVNILNVVEELTSYGCPDDVVAECLGVNINKYKKLLKKHKEIATARVAGKARLKADAWSIFRTAAARGIPVAMSVWGKHSGVIKEDDSMDSKDVPNIVFVPGNTDWLDNHDQKEALLKYKEQVEQNKSQIIEINTNQKEANTA